MFCLFLSPLLLIFYLDIADFEFSRFPSLLVSFCYGFFFCSFVVCCSFYFYSGSKTNSLPGPPGEPPPRSSSGPALTPPVRMATSPLSGCFIVFLSLNFWGSFCFLASFGAFQPCRDFPARFRAKVLIFPLVFPPLFLFGFFVVLLFWFSFGGFFPSGFLSWFWGFFLIIIFKYSL